MSPAPDWLIVADDLTGACDTGAAFAVRGWSTRVAFGASALTHSGADFSGVQVRVTTTESRHLEAEQAVRAVEQAVRRLLMPGAFIYKKIDSTLRGHPGVELSATMQALDLDRALVAPAFPEQGRVTRGGRVWVNGQPLEQTAFGREVSQPDLVRLFATGKPARLVGLDVVRGDTGRLTEALAQPGVIIADAERPEDLLALARAGMAAGIRLWCGSAGLARALIALQPARETRDVFSEPVGRVLAVVGSRCLAALQQVEAARAVGTAVLAPSLDDLRIAKKARALAAEVVHTLQTSGQMLVCAAGIADQPGCEQEIVLRLGELTAGVLSAAPGTGLVLTGGDTAAAVCQALGCNTLDLTGEIEPGVVLGRLASGPHRGLPVITKAGGFGGTQTLLHAMQVLNGVSHGR